MLNVILQGIKTHWRMYNKLKPILGVLFISKHDNIGHWLIVL